MDTILPLELADTEGEMDALVDPEGDASSPRRVARVYSPSLYLFEAGDLWIRPWHASFPGGSIPRRLFVPSDSWSNDTRALPSCSSFGPPS